MVLSRIWTAFIVIAILVAGARMVFEPGQKQLLSQMVTGKNTDTIQVREIDTSTVTAADAANLQLSVAKGKEKVYKTTDGHYRAYRLLPANGIFETCKDAVNLCIGLIGIMALFMGFMNIAEKAGGIRL